MPSIRTLVEWVIMLVSAATPTLFPELPAIIAWAFYGAASGILLAYLIAWIGARLDIKQRVRKMLSISLIVAGSAALVAGAILTFHESSASQSNGPKMAMRFVHPKIPAMQLVNESDHIARDIKWTVLLWNKRLLPGRVDPLPIPVQTFDWIKGGQNGGPQALFQSPGVRSLIQDGDELVGTTSVNCPDCAKGKTYVVFIKFGEGGWYSEIKSETTGNVLVPQTMTEESLRGYFEHILIMSPADSRIKIAEG